MMPFVGPRMLVWAWVLWACMGGVWGASRAVLVDNGYEGVVVGVSPEVDPSLGPAIVDALQDMLDEASRRLFRATRGRAYFRRVKVLVPKSWQLDGINTTALSESFEDSDIRIDVASSVYRNQPYTHQAGACGTPGLFVHLTPEYLTDRKEAAWWGPRGKAFLMEWAKLRWGVFDELGYPGDPSFPLFYPHFGRPTPTHCADQPVEGRMIDKGGRSACGVDALGDPDANCRFLPYREQFAASSLMSYPFIFSDTVVEFCDDPSSDHPHNPYAPTRHNLMCGGRSVWDVMRTHPDFADGANPRTERYVDPEIVVVQHSDANYALVLDYSGSMNDHYRILKLQKTARRWLLHEVADGSEVAVIKFSKHAKLVHRLTRVDSMEARRQLADSIDTSADGGTSIGAGLYAAVKKVLAGKKNPVILLITDGEENENPRIDHILQDVIDSGVRVVTVAFGELADPRLERVAQVTGGKTFTVNDIDEGHMLDDAFHGALTYQPTPARQNQTVVIDEKVYKGPRTTAGDTFLVDFSVGRNLIFRLDTDDPSHVTSPPHLVRPGGGVVGGAEFDATNFVWSIHVPVAEQGEWRWEVRVSGNRDNFVRVKVSAMTRDPTIHPITTRAWMSSGSRDVNATRDRVVIYAEVKQGNNPVVNAKVVALVTPPNESDRGEVYELLDNGAGADIQAGDGIYSRYMTSFPSTGRYSVKAQVTDGGSAVINRGFLTAPSQRAKRDTKELMYSLEDRPEYCCGSVVPLDRLNTQGTGTFNRIAVGGSVKVVEVPDKDIQPPSAVRDLHAIIHSPVPLLEGEGDGEGRGHLLSLSWTAPGDDLDTGIVTRYDIRYSSDLSALTQFANVTSLDLDPPTHAALLLQAGSKVTLNMSVHLDLTHEHYFVLWSQDDVGLVSGMSNVAVVQGGVVAAEVVVVPVWAVVVLVALLVALMAASVLVLSQKNTGKYDVVENLVVT